MARLFLSHSSKDNVPAVALAEWLRAQGWDDVFLDLDPQRGIAAGERWERALHEASLRCEAVLFLISRAWLASGWCLKEHALARGLNKPMFAVLIEPGLEPDDLPPELRDTWQVLSLSAGQDHTVLRVTLPGSHVEGHASFSQEGLARLKRGLDKAGLDPRFFAWPPPGEPARAPYRGLRALEAEDAGILFGREAPIVEATDRLRGLASGAAPRLMVILGASGAGKSSFLRAGLLPRLARDDRHFLPLPPIRATLSGETGLLGALVRAFPTRGRAELRTALADVSALRALFTDRFTAARAGQDAPPKLVLAIDQAEEFFAASNPEAAALLDLVRALVTEDTPGVIVIFAIRSDSYDRLEHAPALEGLRQHTMPLLPMPRGAYKEVIEGPARRATEAGHKLAIAPALTEALLHDVQRDGGTDALPLLAFTLEQLYLDYAVAGAMRLEDYQTFGGLKGAIEASVHRVFARADADPRIPRDRAARETLLRRGLIPWLAGVDPDSRTPRRQVARRSDIPAEAAPLIDLLIEERLLISDVSPETGLVTIEPAHEALLRQWGVLEGWLAEDFGLLATLEAVKRASRDWDANARAAAWLVHQGVRLDDARALHKRDDIAARLDAIDRAYLVECAEWERRERDAVEALERAVRKGEAASQYNLAALLTALSRIALPIDPVKAVKLALAAWPRTREQHGPRLQATMDALGASVQKQRCRKILHGQDGPLTFAVFSPNGTRILTVSDDNTVRVWDTMTGQMRSILTGHTDRIASAEFSPDGACIVTASNDLTACVWDAATGEKATKLLGHSGWVRSAVFSQDGTRIVTASDDKTARVWNAVTGESLVGLSGHTANVWSATFCANGSRVVTASDDNTARVWETASGKCLAKLNSHTDDIRNAVFSPDGKLIVTASDDNTARVWDAATGRSRVTLFGHTGWVRTAAFSPDGKRIVTACNDATARIWDAATGDIRSELQGHTDIVWSASFSPDGTRIVTASRDNTARIWDAATGESCAELSGHTGNVWSAAFSPDGMRIVTASTDGSARVWDAVTGYGIPHAALSGHIGRVWVNRFSPDKTRIITASSDTAVRVWDAATQKCLADLSGHVGRIRSTAFSQDGALIVTASDDRTARIWNVSTGESFRELSGHTGGVLNAEFAPDGDLIVTASSDNTVRVWDAATGQPLLILNDTSEGFKKAYFSQDRTQIITSSTDNNNVRIWDISTLPKGNIFQVACAQLPDHDLTDIAKEYGLTDLPPICQGDPPLPDDVK